MPQYSMSSTAGLPAGQRIAEYENRKPSSAPTRPLDVKVAIKFGQDNLTLPELPNELWEKAMVNLDKKTHKVMGLVSRRFRGIESTQATWRMSFMRDFPGQKGKLGYSKENPSHDEVTPSRPSVRYFSGVSQMDTWSEEYAKRTSLLHDLSRGKATSGFSKGNTKVHRLPTVNYYPDLIYPITHLDAVFPDGQVRFPIAIHGTSTSGRCSAVIPTHGLPLLNEPTDIELGSHEEWDPYARPYGLGNGPVVVPNVMAVSQRYGYVYFGSYPGGRGGFQAPKTDGHMWVQKLVGLPHHPSSPRADDCVTAAWIAKSPTICKLTRGMVGVLAGSAKGFLSAYSLDGKGAHSMQRETVSWAISPGVPIVSIKVDEQYTDERASAGRTWAVVLNALGEIYTLADIPRRQTGQGNAWDVGRSAFWNLVTLTRRRARLSDVKDKTKAADIAAQRTASPRSPAWFHNLSPEQLVELDEQIDNFCNTMTPTRVQKWCLGWDMRRHLEVDFSAGNGTDSFEQVFVVTCGLVWDCPAEVRRYNKIIKIINPSTPQGDSIFVIASVSTTAGELDSASYIPSGGSGGCSVSHYGKVRDAEWRTDVFSFGKHEKNVITAVAIDMSNPALRTVGEKGLDPERVASPAFPGRGARWIAIGTDKGAVFVWDGRFASSPYGERDPIRAIRVIQTQSPGVSCLAISSLVVVHGGTDGRVQAWDPLCSTLGSVRVLNTTQPRNKGVVVANMRKAVPNAEPSVGAIYLDPDPTKLRGLVTYGRVVRLWSYGDAACSSFWADMGRKLRNPDTHQLEQH